MASQGTRWMLRRLLLQNKQRRQGQSSLFPSVRGSPAASVLADGSTFFSTTSSSSSSPQQHHQQSDLPSTSSQWFLQAPRKGSGFDNFTPKQKKSEEKQDDDKKTRNDKEESKKSSDDSDSSSSFGSFRFGGSGGSGGGGGDPSRWETWVPALVMLLLAYTLTGNDDDKDRHGSGGSGDGSAMDREISWHDFLVLLQQQDVVKIVVTDDRETARIYLKPNAVGLSSSSSSHGHGASSSLHAHPRLAGGGGGAAEGSRQRNLSYEERRRLQQQKRLNHASSSSAASSPSQAQENENFLNSSNSAASSSASSGVEDHQLQTASFADVLAMPGQQQHTPFFYRMPLGSVESFERKLDEAQRALKRHPNQDVPVQYLPTFNMTREILSVIPGLLLAGTFYAALSFAGRSFGAGGGGSGRAGGGGGMGGLFQIGKSTARKIAKEDVGVTFKDVAGCEQAKMEVMEFVDFLKDSERFTKLGAKIPKGALLCGPPGTGKTLLAKAVAGESGVPFFSISGSDFIEMFVGVGPSRVRDLFSEARQSAPCIIFIDEIDAVGRQRGRGGLGGNDERENTLNQLLVEMDGFEPSSGVVVLAGTNRVDILDQALTRPGRFDRQITVDKPDLAGRKDIFKVHLQGITLEGGDVESMAGRLSGLTPGFAGADIANICNEAAIVAARRNAETVTMDDFEKAIDRVIGGLESNKIMSKEERSIVAHHEAGHAVAGWFLEHADPLMKVTIIPRTSGALGFAQYLPKEVFLRTHAQIMDIVCMALAGRAAEEIFFGRVTTGAQDDLRRVTDIVYGTIQLYGMNDRLGQLSFPKDPNAFFEERPYSDKTAKAMDEEARAIVDGAYERTLELLREKKQQVEDVAALLLEKETITHDDMVNVIGERPFQEDPQYREFIRRGGSGDKPNEETEKKEGVDTLTPEPSA